jgi:N-acetylglutamate synthase/N-acetylornithine aminotransferase
MSNSSVTGPKGFMAAGVSCGIKQSGRPDLGLLVCRGGIDIGLRLLFLSFNNFG